MTRFAGIPVVVLFAACSSAARPAPRADAIQQRAAARPAVSALRAGDFPRARWAANRVLRGDRTNAVAAAVRALTTYQDAGHRLRGELVELVARAWSWSQPSTGFDHARARRAWTDFAAALARVDADLAIAAADPELALELCLGCWTHDWNGSGEIDDGDRRLFQIELDRAGAELPADDPRRNPTFRFDAGDVVWARAMVAFQRAVVELILAYRWDQLDRLMTPGEAPRIVLELADPGRVRRARELIRAGLAHSDRSRELYLAETDDDREWVPNPRQTDHAVPLELDAAMYDAWAAITRDLRALVDGREGLPLAVAGGRDVRGLSGYLDVGRLFDHPQDLVLDFPGADAAPAGTSPAVPLIEGAFGHAIVHHMAESPLAARLRRIARELERDEDTLARKLRYVLWIN
jgi:hypothetical protein